MRGFIGALLMAGLLAGCGGAVEATQTETPATVEAMATCADCHNLYVRCMSRATTPEAKADCEYGRMDCEATFCPDPPAREDAPSTEKASTSDYTTNPYCWHLESSTCVPGSKRNCSDGIGGTFACYCRTGEWDCPPYDEV